MHNLGDFLRGLLSAAILMLHASAAERGPPPPSRQISLRRQVAFALCMQVFAVLVLLALFRQTLLGQALYGWLAVALAAWAIGTWQCWRIVIENFRLRSESEQAAGKLREQVGEQAALRERMEKALAAAQQACLDKTRFLAAASHDLRQPVHAISLFVAALKLEDFDSRAKYLVDRLDRSLAGLDELFNRLLDISRLDAGVITPAFKVFEALPIGQTLETRYGPLAQSKALRFKVRCPKGLFLHTDVELLIELIMNLLSNAFRYTERGGVLLAFRARANSVLVQVWDTGCGIPEDNLDLIFDEFVQLGNPSRDRRKGLGLGLAIVRRLCGILGCGLRVRSKQGKGSVFEIEVERSTSISALEYAAGDGKAPEQDPAGTLVLVVDDEIDILAAMEAILSSWGCYAILARSTDEALKYVDDSLRYPDVLITDHRLGHHKTSFDVVAAVSSVVPYRLPVIVISGESNSSLEREVLERGWTFMNKPVNAPHLRHALLRSLALGRQEFQTAASAT